MTAGPAATPPATLPALTGLRGLAALWVFLHHMNSLRYGSGAGFHVLARGCAVPPLGAGRGAAVI